jgi:hypothetical protein
MAQGDEAALIAAEQARRAAIVRDDADALEAGMADHFHYAHINGMVEDRAAFLARIRAGVVKTPRTEATDLKVTLRDGYALLTGKSYIEFAWTTHENSGFVETLFTAVWEKQSGAWKIAAYASTPLPT